MSQNVKILFSQYLNLYLCDDLVQVLKESKKKFFFLAVYIKTRCEAFPRVHVLRILNSQCILYQSMA